MVGCQDAYGRHYQDAYYQYDEAGFYIQHCITWSEGSISIHSTYVNNMPQPGRAKLPMLFCLRDLVINNPCQCVFNVSADHPNAAFPHNYACVTSDPLTGTLSSWAMHIPWTPLPWPPFPRPLFPGPLPWIPPFSLGPTPLGPPFPGPPPHFLDPPPHFLDRPPSLDPSPPSLDPSTPPHTSQDLLKPPRTSPHLP